MTDTVLSMTEVHKAFRRRAVLEGCSFEVERGTVTALVGSNGAGKSTLMSLAAGLLVPEAGSISVLGHPIGTQGISPGLSYLAQHTPLYRRFTVSEMLRFGRCTNDSWDGAYASQIVDSAGIDGATRIAHLSPGQQTRVALAVVLGRRPQIVLLDEPLADLDPVARRDVARLLMSDAAEFGTTMVISSHVLVELIDIADHLLLLRDRRITLSGNLDEVTAGHYVLTGPGDPAAVVADGQVVTTDRSAGSVVVRGRRPSPPPGWQVHDASLDDVVLAHLDSRGVS